MLQKENLVGAGLIIILLHVAVSSVSGQNQTCPPSSCGDTLNITDPFRLKGAPSSCGDRRYELACENNRTVLNLYRGKYYVEEINYQNYSIRVVDTGLKKGDCFSVPVHRLTPDNFSYGDPYHWPYDWKLRTTVLMSCSTPITGDDGFVPITPCNSSDAGNSSSHQSYDYALTGDEGSLQVADLPVSCTIGKSMFSDLTEDSEPAQNRTMSSLQDELLLGVELSFLEIQCIRKCKVKGESCYMDYNLNSVKCYDPNACNDWVECYKPEWLRTLFLILLIIFASIYTPIIAGGLIVRGLIGAGLCYLIYKYRQRRMEKQNTTTDMP